MSTHGIALKAGGMLGGRYRIISMLGEGGMGTVYGAHHVDLDRPVALKVISPRHAADARIIERFRREARMSSQARHPNIVEVLDLGQADGLWYLAMEMLEGVDLYDAIVMKRNYEPAELVPVLDQVLAGLEAAHALGLVHRDLKPENIFLARSGEGEFTVKLLDFGVVKIPDEGAQAQLTRTGTVVGTPEYMSPEQATDNEVDARSDLYSIGCVAYCMLCGLPPFTDKSVLKVLTAHVCESPKPPSKVRPGLPHGAKVDRFVLRALEKQPAARYQTAAEMRAALHELAAALGSIESMRVIAMPDTPSLTNTNDLSRTLPDRAHSLATTSPAPSRPAGEPEPAADAAPKPQPPKRPATVTAETSPRPGGVSTLGVLLAATIGAVIAAAVTYFILRR
jgi:serine/threonine-protein kinase